MLTYPHPHYNQIEPGYVGHDAVSSNHGNRGETSERVRNLENGPYGRSLAGFGRDEYEGDSDYEDDKLSNLEGQDDVVGSGIFDDAGSEATIHNDMGVFADHPNLPGYIARERQFEPNESLEDLTTGGDVIAVPGGGMTYGGRMIGPGTISPQLPFRYESALTPPSQPRQAAYVPMHGPATQIYRPQPAPLVNTVSRPVPAPMPVPNPKVGCGCWSAPAPVAPRRRSISGLGEAASASTAPASTSTQPSNGGSSWLPYVAGGLIAGAAVALLMGSMSKKTA